MKKALLFILSALLMVLAGCTEGQEKPLRTNTQDKPAEPKVVFTLPEGWKYLEDSPNYAYAPETSYVFQDGRDAPGPADLALQYSQKDSSISAEKRRDEAYQEMECHAGGEEADYCVKNLRKDQTQVNNTVVYLLHYDEATFLKQSVTVAFWDKGGLSNSVMIRGDFQKHLPGLVSVVQTLHHE